MCRNANENLEVILGISINSFRNIEKLKIDNFKKINFIVGDNGQGKTNLIESIFISSKGRSFRFSEAKDFIKFKEKAASISTVLIADSLEFDITVQIQGSRLSQKINSKTATKSDSSDLLPVLLFSPESLSYIKESGEERRDLVDGSLIQTHSSLRKEWLEWAELKKSRAAVLKDNLDGKFTKTTFFDLLESINKQFYASGENWTLKRIEYLTKVQKNFNEIAEYILGENFQASFEYLIGDEEVLQKTTNDILLILSKKHAFLKEKEVASGLNLWGPHKHQFKILFNGNDSRIFCSQGQQRTLILAYKLAQLVYHYETTKRHPVLLLDDVLSELDKAKQERLLQYLEKQKSQVFITTTHLDYPLKYQQKMDLKDVDVEIFEISAGKIISK